MNRALPGWAVDLIRDGVGAEALRAQGDRAVFGALVSTAASAWQRGWGQPEWEGLVMDARSTLGRQVTVDRDRKARTPRAVIRTLANAWDRAVAWVNERPAWSGEQAHDEARERARLALLVAGDADQPLSDAQRAVLAHAAEQAARPDRAPMLQVPLPRQPMLEATGLGLTALRTALAGLEALGLLTLTEHGRPGGPSARRRRANRYALADAATLAHYLCPETGPVVPPDQSCGAPTESASGAPDQSCGAPSVTTAAQPDAPTREAAMSDTITLTLSPAERAAVLQTLAAMRAADAAEPDALPGNVVPLRPTAGGAR